MWSCNHTWRGGRNGSDILVSYPVKQLPWKQSVAEPWATFTRDRQSQLCFSWVSYNRSLRVQLFWSWPHILSAKAVVDTIYGVAWGSMLSNVRWNHKGEPSGLNRGDLIPMEDWTSSPKTACLGYGWLNIREWNSKCSSLIISGMWS